MIFVTVGTHEQGMDRLLKKLDELIELKVINQKVYAQIGYSKYYPQKYQYSKMLSYEEMQQYMREAEIIITHGGPGSIFQSLQFNKTPIVIPRNPAYNEHVDNHQILFAQVLEKNEKIIAVYDINDLETAILEFTLKCDALKKHFSQTNEFLEKFDILMNKLLTK